MTTKIPFLCAAALVGCFSGFAQQASPATDDRLATLKALKIDAATITQV